MEEAVEQCGEKEGAADAVAACFDCITLQPLFLYFGSSARALPT
jgi:hypothetical protein